MSGCRPRRGAGRLLPVALLALTAACNQGTREASGPPSIRYGRDLCDRCGMVIDDPRTAAAARTSLGRELRFDDLADLVALARESPELLREGWVRDWNGGGWLSRESASFVRSSGLATPMGSGLAAFATPDAAVRFAAERHGEVLGWNDLVPR